MCGERTPACPTPTHPLTCWPQSSSESCCQVMMSRTKSLTIQRGNWKYFHKQPHQVFWSKHVGWTKVCCQIALSLVSHHPNIYFAHVQKQALTVYKAQRSIPLYFINDTSVVDRSTSSFRAVSSRAHLTALWSLQETACNGALLSGFHSSEHWLESYSIALTFPITSQSTSLNITTSSQQIRRKCHFLHCFLPVHRKNTLAA